MSKSYNVWNKWRTTETYLEWLPNGYKEKIQQLVYRKLKIGGGACLVSVRRTTHQALKHLGMDHRRTSSVILSFAYGCTARMFEFMGGKIFDYISRHGDSKQSTTPMRRVYKFG